MQEDNNTNNLPVLGDGSATQATGSFGRRLRQKTVRNRNWWANIPVVLLVRAGLGGDLLFLSP